VTPWITGSTRAKLTKAGASNIEIPLPPLAEQKRIARILDAADALRTKRREALAQLDALLQSTFLTLFGDPVTNPMGWEESTIDALVENIDSGWSPTCLDRPAKDEEWGVLKLGAVTYCVYREDQTKALPSDLTPRPEIEVQKGDLLFARKNTYELVAACAYVHQTRPRLMLPDLIFRLRLSKASKAEPIFMWQQLIVPRLRKHIQSFAGGAAGSMPNISKAKLRSIEVILPPLSLQQKFARIVESVERQKAAQRAHLAELDALFASLQYRAFRGELSDSK
jgi:type I restriction enzyme S subunit